MKGESVLYTDGHDVTVTDSRLQVRKRWYQLSGITRHNFSILRPDKFPAILLLVAGSAIEVVGAADLIPVNWMSRVNVFGLSVTANQIAMVSGIVLLLIGAGVMWSLKERYAVSITTAEGERNVVVSERKEYISQIIHALNEAFFSRIGPGTESGTKKREFIVSGR
ncbi:MAG TPA: DUF6232 family protein [Cyclobacteriaceae bacterium]|nr:DUF6232 family protein [Cyclobacteriaceae bacterium]